MNEIGEEAAKEFDVRFLPSDFKKRGGYQRSIELSKEFGLYRQNYCGCVFSKQAAERKEKLQSCFKEGYERCYAAVDLDAVRNNVLSIMKNAGRSDGFTAVVKADGYGHGAVPVAREIQDLVWGFAAATPEEALELRKAGITKPVIILGHVKKERYPEMILNEIRLPVYSLKDAEILSDTALSLGKKACIHLKVDTGMHRIGFLPDESGLQTAISAAGLPGIEAEGIFTHLATADMQENTASKRQIDVFRAFVQSLRENGVKVPVSHYANSAASILFDCSDSALLRVGIALYGLNPSDECDYSAAKLQPALSWYSEISYVKTLPEGMPVSYGGTFVTDREMRIATVSVGYADGYPRALSNRAEVLVSGVRCRILGRVCMDQMMIDVTDVPEASEGTRVTLIGRSGDERITMEELAQISGRFNYELACDISRRVPRVYLKNGKAVSARDWFS